MSTNVTETQLAIRFPVALVERIERHADRLAQEHPGLKITRAGTLRALLNSALDQAERVIVADRPRARARPT